MFGVVPFTERNGRRTRFGGGCHEFILGQLDSEVYGSDISRTIMQTSMVRVITIAKY